MSSTIKGSEMPTLTPEETKGMEGHYIIVDDPGLGPSPAVLRWYEARSKQISEEIEAKILRRMQLGAFPDCFPDHVINLEK